MHGGVAGRGGMYMDGLFDSPVCATASCAAARRAARPPPNWGAFRLASITELLPAWGSTAPIVFVHMEFPCSVVLRAQ